MQFCLVILLSLLAFVHSDETCSLSSEEIHGRDPALKVMKYDIGMGEQRFLAYVEPSMDTFYNGNPPASVKVEPMFRGLSSKFINISPEPVVLFWLGNDGSRVPMNRLAPFEATGTASFPGHVFIFTSADEKKELQRFNVEEAPKNLFVYDPFYVQGDEAATERNLKRLHGNHRWRYDKWRRTLDFNDVYLNFTGRSYLANYLRDRPSHFMWRADYFGQEHWVTSPETHLTTPPPKSRLNTIVSDGPERTLKDGAPRTLRQYRDSSQPYLNMTIKVVSCAPRVFEIENFLSSTEIEHIITVAGHSTLKRSSVGDVGSGNSKALGSTSDTRTSKNSWLPRHTDPIFDALYRRSADLLRMDEALLRPRTHGQHPDRESKNTLAEDLQLVHYDPGEQYTDHHDFGFSNLDEPQEARFATILFYLNEPEEGGETSFPRYANAETFKRLKVAPKLGKAVLFYSVLPDGNLDDLSHHAALPVLKGEKWLTNLWVWDPVYK